MRKFILTLGIVAVVALGIVPVIAQSNTISDVVSGDDRFQTLSAALTAAGLTGTFSGAGPYTVFAPTDAAFAALPEGALEELLGDTAALTNLLKYHVVSGSLGAADLVGLSKTDTLSGAPLFFNSSIGTTVLNGSVNVVTSDIQASNGVIHVVDAVLLPSETGLHDLVLVNGDVPLLDAPGGNPTGATLRNCQTAVVFERLGGYGYTNMGGWIDLSATSDVAENYGQPGGQPIAPQCQ